jgi:hypothetical protein
MEIRDKELKDIVEFVKGTPRAEQVYGRVVNDLLRQQYKADRVESILNNYLDDMTNKEHEQEFNELQAYRKECKLEAKRILGIE